MLVNPYKIKAITIDQRGVDPTNIKITPDSQPVIEVSCLAPLDSEPFSS